MIKYFIYMYVGFTLGIIFILFDKSILGWSCFLFGSLYGWNKLRLTKNRFYTNLSKTKEGGK